MVPVYTFVADIIASPSITSEEQFREAIDQHLIYLRSFPVAYGRSQCKEVYYPPSGDNDKPDSELWAYRCVLSLSVGKNKIEKIGLIYEALLTLLSYELPNFQITAEANQWNFSSDK
jgi:hypothetical protein